METPISNLLQRFETNMTSAPSGWRSPSPATPGRSLQMRRQEIYVV